MIKSIIKSILLLLIIFTYQTGNTQNIVNDSFCVQIGEPFIGNIMANDKSGQGFPRIIGQSFCFSIDQEGNFLFIGDEDCCGDHVVEYNYPQASGGDGEVGLIFITIKCPKPDCSIVNLDDLNIDPNFGFPIECINACENNVATYYTYYNPSNTYTWTITNGVYVTVGNPATIEITWGSSGSGNIQLDIFNGITTITKTFCVDILDGPTAAFTPLTNYVCLNSPISFINNSINGNSYHWNFGDGNYSNTFQPTHTYSSPGIYDVVLTVTKENYDIQGNPLCCCTDSIMVQIEVDPKPGPNIYWISTLCAGDSSKYWTDAVGCSYIWNVEDALGNIIPIIGPSTNDTICVIWGDGPHGIVTLQVTGCTTYCNNPVSALVPIISTVEDIKGETIVCSWTSYTYDLPKWPSVTYDWSVTGGIISSGQGMNSITIVWGPAGPGTIHVDYHSEFLGGLPGHTLPDCSGIADLDVVIKDEYSVITPDNRISCVGDTSVYTTSNPGSFFWVVTPSATILGQGTDQVSIIWPSTGSYKVLVYPLGINPFCNDSICNYMNVVDINRPDSISGSMSVCPNSSEIYFAHSSETDIGFIWNVVGGTPSIDTGDFISILWGASPPYQVCLSQFMLSDPSCISDTICKPIFEKTIITPLVVTGPSGCVDEVKAYSLSPAQHPDANFYWKIIPPNMGSVYNGQGTTNVDIQWNNVQGPAVIKASVILCGDTISENYPIIVYPKPIPVITQIGVLCPGVPAILEASPSGVGVTYNWSNGGTSQQISIFSDGVYTVTVTDGNSCSAITTYEAFNVAGPDAKITTNDKNPICIGVDPTVTLHTLTNPNYEFTWYKNGSIVQGPDMMASYTHVLLNTVGSCTYTVKVEDLITGCIKTSLSYTVYESNCPPDPCDNQAYSFTANNTNLISDCDHVQFGVTTTNITVTDWDFGDGSGSFTGPITAPIHHYAEAGYYYVEVCGNVPENLPGTGFCRRCTSTQVTVPLAARFRCETFCDSVQFTDESTHIMGNPITSYLWNFSDGGTSTLQNPSHIFTGGSYGVTLTITDAMGCAVTFFKNININYNPTPIINMSMNPVCPNDPILFTVSGTGSIISYDWNFGDGSGNGAPMPFHSYTSSGTYIISLTVVDVNGCIGTSTSNVLVHPAPIIDTITYLPSLLVCDGESVILTAPAGASWVWSDGSTGSTLTTSVSGVFSVVVTDINGCFYETEEVTVTVLPPLDNTIAGDTIICDQGCVTLTAPSGFGHQYTWKEVGGSVIGTNQTLEICFNTYYAQVYVEITDDNGCMTVSAIKNISLENSPIITIIVIGDLCAESPNILQSGTVLPNIDYSWSTGATGPIITTDIAGTYTLYGRDINTGCVGSASVTVHPVPNLCIMPTGCYETCDPDTICGPDGMLSYQWNMNGAPLLGDTSQCLIVHNSGSYSLTAENNFHCFKTSDTLILVVIPCCDDEDTWVDITHGEFMDSCCYSLDYFNNFTDITALNIHTADGDLSLISLDPAFSVSSSSATHYTLVSNIPPYLPGGLVTAFSQICIKNPTSNPQMILFDWMDSTTNVFCQDTLWFHCPVEPDCIYIADESIYCEDDIVYYTLTICNPSSNNIDFRYISLLSLAPVGATLNPSFIDLTGTPLTPGNCITHTVQVLGTGISNQNLCINLIGHEYDPNIVDDAICCSLDTVYCTFIPGCNPCEQVYVESIDYSDPKDSCCYDVVLHNYYDATSFNGIDLCVLTPNTTFGVNVPLGGNWTTQSLSSTVAQLNTTNTSGYLPLGSIQLPEICITNSENYVSLIEIKWMLDDNVVCRDTIELICKGDCGHFEDIEVLCDGAGGWVVQGFLTNDSPITMNTATINFNNPGLEIYNTTLSLGSLLPGSTFGPFSFGLGAPAFNGQLVHMTIVLHALDDDANHSNCCSFDQYITLPPCGDEPNCLCDDQFELEVSYGAQILNITDDFVVTFAPLGNFSDCDLVYWNWIDLELENKSVGNESIDIQYPHPGEYKYCMTVLRTQPDGKQCKFKFTGEFIIPEPGIVPPGIYPNPSTGDLTIEFNNVIETNISVDVFNMSGEKVKSQLIGINDIDQDNRTQFKNLDTGIYYLYIKYNNEVFIKKFIVMK